MAGAVLSLCTCGLELSAASSVPEVGAPEYAVKAAFLFNFAHFVEWPNEAFPSTDAPIVIGILGSDPFGKSLDEIVAGESIQGRALVVRRYRKIEEVVGCHILFISGAETKGFLRGAVRLQGTSTLTVGEDDAGMIQFFTEHNKLRLRIDLQAARAAGLTISSKLLRQAQIVGQEPQL
jgi:hypothetical protein